MRIISLYILLLFLASCVSKQQSDLMTIDVTKSYPQKVLKLDEIASVEYVKPSTANDFLAKSRALALTDHYIVEKGPKESILIFDRQGNPVSSFSHEGNGPHEYLYASTVMLDEEQSLVYVHDIQMQKMFIYQLNGEFFNEYDTDNFRFVYQFDDEHFIVYHQITNRVNISMTPYFSIVSKNTGQQVKKIEVPLALEKAADLSITVGEEEQQMVYSAMHLPLVRTMDGGFLLNEVSCDTIYKINRDLSVVPQFVRKPSLDNNTQVFLEAGLETTHYQFFTCTTKHPEDMDNMFEEVQLVYDKQEQQIYRYSLSLDDYEDYDITFTAHNVNSDTKAGIGLGRISVYDLQEADEKGLLHGRLEEMAATLDDEDNPIVIVYHFK